MAQELLQNVPADLLQLPHWVCWWSVVGEGKQVKLPGGRMTTKPLPVQPKAHKLPINPKTGNHAATDNPKTWTTVQEAIAGLAKWGVTGVGFVGTKECGLVLTDLDHCREPETGIIAPWARAIVENVNSYTEISPSGTGLHIWAYGEKPPEGCKKDFESGQVEMYVTERYLTVTGDHLAGTPKLIGTRRLNWLRCI